MGQTRAQELGCVVFILSAAILAMAAASTSTGNNDDVIPGAVAPSDYYDYYDVKPEQVSPAELERAYMVMNAAWRNLYRQAYGDAGLELATAQQRPLGSSAARAVAKRFASKRQMRYKQCFFNPVTCFGHRK
ncbi:unnamed protein product [Notodromas monacha]|uniref:Uncharacterized protein n=1 Tax=Notodromas monacha TaxID=399045 RepID=A0A7R9BHQ0_9CRUS|nr:unnamed protein product [Notodromas monacha]CAG0914327.1 unnamed protein product [Notodromas monacha]